MIALLRRYVLRKMTIIFFLSQYGSIKLSVSFGFVGRSRDYSGGHDSRASNSFEWLHRRAGIFVVDNVSSTLQMFN